MLAKYQENFASLTPEAAHLVASALLKKHPEVIPHAELGLYGACEAAGLDQASVVMSLANDPTPLGVVALETLVGQPIIHGRPALKGFQRSAVTGKMENSTEPKMKNVRAPRPPQNDPRVIATVASNPKKPGSASYDRYALYVPGMTVSQAIAAGVKKEDIAWDSDPKRGFITFAK